MMKYKKQTQEVNHYIPINNKIHVSDVSDAQHAHLEVEHSSGPIQGFHNVFFSGAPHDLDSANVQKAYHTVSPTMYGFRNNLCKFSMHFDESEKIASIQVNARVDGEPLDVIPKVSVDVTRGGLGEKNVELKVHSNVAKTWHAVARVVATKVANKL